jgi:hypothetical protein
MSHVRSSILKETVITLTRIADSSKRTKLKDSGKSSSKTYYNPYTQRNSLKLPNLKINIKF